MPFAFRLRIYRHTEIFNSILSVLWVSKGTCNRPSSFHKISQESNNPYIAEITGNWNSYLCDAWRNKLNIRSYTLPLLNKVPAKPSCQYFYSIKILFVSFRGSKFSWLFFFFFFFMRFIHWIPESNYKV